MPGIYRPGPVSSEELIIGFVRKIQRDTLRCDLMRICFHAAADDRAFLQFLAGDPDRPGAGIRPDEPAETLASAGFPEYPPDHALTAFST